MKAKVVQNYDFAIILIKKMDDGQLVISDSNSTIRFLDKDTLATINGFKAKTVHKYYKNRIIDFSSDKNFFGTLTEDHKETRLFSVATKKAIAKVARHQGEVSCVGIDPRNRYLFSCGEDGKTFVIDIKNAKMAFTLPPHPDTINDIVFNKSGQWVARASYDRKISIYNLDIMQQREKLTGHAKPVMKLCFISKNRLFSVDKDNAGIIWNLYNSNIIARVTGIHDDVTAVVADSSGQYIFIGTKLGYVIVYDAKKYEFISQEYLKFKDSITSMFYDNETDMLYIGFESGDIKSFYIYEGIDAIKRLIYQKDFGKVEEYINENPILKNTAIYDVLEQLWEKTLSNARKLLEAGKNDDALKMLETYRTIPSKNSMINKLIQDFTDFKKFRDLAVQGKYALAYSMANQVPAYKESSLFKQLEKQWREKFKQAQKLSLSPKTLDQAKELLKPYRGISEKAKDIQEMFVQSDVYNRFKIALGEKNFKQVYAFLDKYPFLKQFPEYEMMINYGDSLYHKAIEHMNDGELGLALKYLRMLSEFEEFKSVVKDLIDDIDTRYKFFMALKEDDISKAYYYLAQNEELLATKEGKRLESAWDKALLIANRYAAKGDVAGVKKALEEFLSIPSKFSAIASVFAYTYMSQLEKAIKQKLPQNMIEQGIKNYISLFGINEQIETLYKIFKKYYPESKLNIELLQEGTLLAWRPKMIVESILEEV